MSCQIFLSRSAYLSRHASSIDRQVMLPFRGANCAIVSQPLLSLGLQIQLGIVLPQRALNHRIFGQALMASSRISGNTSILRADTWSIGAAKAMQLTWKHYGGN